MPLSKTTNVATFRLAPGYRNFEAYNAVAGFKEDDKLRPILCQEANIIEDDTNEYIKPANVWQPSKAEPRQVTMDLNQSSPQLIAKGDIPIVDNEPDVANGNDSALLLRYHQMYGHISFQRIKDMARVGMIPKRLAKCMTPACSACLYAKSTRKPWRGKPSQEFTPKVVTTPGAMVSVDQLVSPTPGLIARMTGKFTTKRYKYATVFVDQASKLGYVYLQKTATVEETLQAKKSFQQYSWDRGVKILAYHADNGIFRANEWQQACQREQQPLTFVGVSAHHTNGLAEKRIRDLQDLTRTELIHASSKWNGVVTANLWPYAMRLANDALNNSPSPQDKARRTPEQIFAKSNVVPNAKHYKPFGCPVYVLESALQNLKTFHKWKQRSHVGLYLGKSPQHSLVLYIKNGLVSSQFHVTHDPSFKVLQQHKFVSTWQYLAGFKGQKASKLHPTKGNKTTSTPTRMVGATNACNNVSKTKKRIVKFASHSTRKKAKITQGRHSSTPIEGDTPAAARSSQNVKILSTKTPEMGPANIPDQDMAVANNANTSTLPHLIETHLAEITQAKPNQHDKTNHVPGEIFCYMTLYPDADDHQEGGHDPLYASKASTDPDILYLHEAMKAEDWPNFRAAMQKGIDDRMEGKNFSVIHKAKVPRTATILPAVWQMRRKRDIKSGTIKNYKARLNIDGSRMRKGIHYDQSYAPVASWNSIRLLLIMTAVHRWHTKQLDYVAAFPQAPCERELYMKIPKGVTLKGKGSEAYVLKLHKNTYGQKNAGRVWNDYLVAKLKKIGFKQSSIDRCVFYKGKVVYALYTDDSILAGPCPKEIDNIMA